MFRLPRLLAVVAVLLSVWAPTAGSAGQDPDDSPRPSPKRARNNVYLVRMAEDPVVGYRGGIPGHAATRPARGRKIDPNNPDVARYAAYLDERHNAALAHAGGGRKLYDYRYAVNGFAAELTSEQAAKLAEAPGVLSVRPDYLDPVETVSTPGFLGLTAPGGLWEQLGGVGASGEDVIVGVIDTGIWPEHPGVSDRTRSNKNGVEGRLAYHQIPGWHGKCVPGEAFNASHCNQKLIGCQFFGDAFGTDNLDPTEYLSCRDSDSHGTHTATTAAGNANVAATIDGHTLGLTSGVAPRARLSIYKVCWREPGQQALCSGADRAAAIDQAVHDGVDVLNHSIGTTTANFLDPVQVAFLFAADAGVFVATSAGNSGPTLSTVASPGPWLTSVAASTHDRFYQGSTTLGSGASHTGASLTAGTGPGQKPLVHSSSVGLAGKDPVQVTLCFSGTLDPAKAAGKIVLCDRGTNDRVDKSLAVKMAGGAGMILRNVSANTLNADLHSVPSLHVDHLVGATIKSYVDSTPTATARLTDGAVLTSIAAPFIAGFSSRGPSNAVGGDILKPDLTAPGVDVLAGTSPAGNAGRFFDFFSGTSMSSPHVAGLGALFKQRHPDWSPMMIKSALMTTATQILGTGNSANAFAQGAGHVSPNKAADPGLVYDANFDDWIAFICGTGQLADPGCPAIAIDPSDMNVASIAIGDILGTQKVKRRVTNVGPPATYTATVVPPPGMTVSVNPISLELGTGASASFEVTFTRTTVAPFNTYQFGSLTWSDGIRSAKSPLVVRPVALIAPGRLSLSGATGSTSYNVRFGYTGTFAADPRGLVAAVTTPDTVTDDPTNNFNTAAPATSQGIRVHTLTLGAGMILARIALFDDFTDGNDDLDLYVYNAAGQLVGASGGATSAEEVNLNNPAAGTYTIYVHGWETDGPDANYTLFTWTVRSAVGNLTATAPAAATVGGTGTITLNWNGLAPATKYLGVVRYLDGATERARTSVAVNVP